MKQYQVERLVPYEAERLFDLIADVESYPEFLTGWKAARIYQHEQDAYRTDQTLQFGPMRVQCKSRTLLYRPTRIEVESRDWPFRAFHLVWNLEPLQDEACRLSLNARVESGTMMLRLVVERMLPAMVDDIVSSFERRARQLCGAPGGTRPAGSTPDNTAD